MKRTIFLTLAGVTLIGTFLWSVSSLQTPTQSAVQWFGMTDGVKKAQAEQKKILVDVYTDWCKWCKKMDAEVYTDAAVKKYLQEHYVLVKVNAESQTKQRAGDVAVTEAELAQAFHVTGYPTIIFLREDGTAITSLEGYHATPEFLDAVSYIASNAYLEKSFEEWKGKK